MLAEQPESTQFGYQPGRTYEPSPTQIAAECAAIRKCWSPREERKRRAWAAAPRFRIPELAPFIVPPNVEV